MKKSAFIFPFLLLAALAHGQSHYECTHIDNNINTLGSESGAIVVADSILLYTSMDKEDANKLYLIDFTPVLMQVFQADIHPDGTLGQGVPNQWGLNSKGTNCGNVAYDAKNNVIYLTHSNENDDIAHIYYTRRIGNRWSKPQPIGGDVNLNQYTSTHPAVGYLPDGKTILYFSSDRPGGLGGMDLWYAIMITEGRPGNCTNLGAPVNSDSNDITPFYDNEEGRLYFSSSRQGGLGGFDIYYSEGFRNSWQLPHTLGPEINTKFNDLFFSKQPCQCRCPQDSTRIVEACGFLASNRDGALYREESNCCNDLFRWRLVRDSARRSTPVVATNQQRVLDYLPLSLYFHNDEPDPHTLDTTTTANYETLLKRYLQMHAEYQGTQPSPIVRRQWDSIQHTIDIFFQHDLQPSINRLNQFLTLLLQDLRAGRKVSITLNGYASPLFESQYNVNLSKRRTDCIRRHILAWNDEVLLPYLNNGSLQILQAAFGAASEQDISASDPLRNPQSTKSVYSIEAARDRRVDIIDYRYF